MVEPASRIPPEVIPCPTCGGTGWLPEQYGAGWGPDERVIVRHAGHCEDCLGYGQVLGGLPDPQ